MTMEQGSDKLTGSDITQQQASAQVLPILVKEPQVMTALGFCYFFAHSPTSVSCSNCRFAMLYASPSDIPLFWKNSMSCSKKERRLWRSPSLDCNLYSSSRR